MKETELLMLTVIRLIASSLADGINTERRILENCNHEINGKISRIEWSYQLFNITKVVIHI